MTVKEIIEKYLKDNNYDGLYYPGECACKLDDLMPCEDCNFDCQPGILGNCEKCNKKDNDGICHETWDWCIGPKLEDYK